VFCPNCGTQNDSTATPCKKCGFKLSGITAPKFKGTMMLNSEQTVQELIEEHRRKQAQEAVAEKERRSSNPPPKRSPGSSAPPSSFGSTRGPVLQPPRAAPRGRMGGTMLGVAPQGGGVAPPVGVPARPPEVAAPPPSSDAAGEQARHDVSPSAEPARPEESPANPLAATSALPLVSPAPEASVDPGATDATPPAGDELPLAAVPSVEAPPVADTAARVEAVRVEAVRVEAVRVDAAAHEPSEPNLRAAETQPPRNRVVAATTALPAQLEPVATRDTSSAPSSIGPLDVVLIVCTFGLYGIVLWRKQRKRPA
jgi:zinc-ribbon domain